MGTEGLQLDKLESAWRSLREEIRLRENELSALKNEFQILDQARSVLIMRAGAGASSSIPLFTSKRAIGLKEAILACLSASEFGLDMDELIFSVQNKVDEGRYVSDRSLYAAVQTTVRRMIARGEVAITAHDEKRRYVTGHMANQSSPEVTAAGKTEAD